MAPFFKRISYVANISFAYKQEEIVDKTESVPPNAPFNEFWKDGRAHFPPSTAPEPPMPKVKVTPRSQSSDVPYQLPSPQQPFTAYHTQYYPPSNHGPVQPYMHPPMHGGPYVPQPNNIPYQPYTYAYPTHGGPFNPDDVDMPIEEQWYAWNIYYLFLMAMKE